MKRMRTEVRLGLASLLAFPALLFLLLLCLRGEAWMDCAPDRHIMRALGWAGAACGGCLAVGYVLAAFFSRRSRDPLARLGEAARRISAGDLTARVALRGGMDSRAERLAADFNEMARKLEDASRQDLLAVYFHECKAPLAAISGYARLLERDVQPAQREEYARVIREEAGRMAGMADDLLLLARLEREGGRADGETVDVAEQVRRIFSACAPRWQEKGLTLDLGLDDGITVRGQAWMLEHVWRNLIDNAIKYSPAGGTVSVSLRRAEGRARFVIRNFGEPIPPERLARVFDSFTRAGNGGDTPGHGLGLAVVRRVLLLHGGDLRVTSSPGDGTAFTVLL